MPFMSYVFAAILAFIGATVAALSHTQAVNQAVGEEVSAASIRMMAGIARDYIAANPAKSGEVTTSELAPYTPSWFRGDARVRLVAQAGRAYVFIAPQDGERTSTKSVIGGNETPVTLGIAQGGRLISPVAGTVLENIPGAIPNGSVVYVIS